MEWKYTDTRSPDLRLGHFAHGHWQFVDRSSDSQVGPIYKTKMEALADLRGYCAAVGWTLEG
jgi:hypothetical protein